MGKSQSNNLAEITNDLLNKDGVVPANQQTPIFKGHKVNTGKEQQGPAGPSLSELTDGLIQENKKKSGISPESNLSGDTTPSPSSSTGETDTIEDPAKDPAGGIPFLTDFNKKTFESFDGYTTIAGKNVDLKSVDTFPGPYSQEIKNLHRKEVIQRVKDGNINDDDAKALANSVGADPWEVKQSVNAPTSYKLFKAQSTLDSDITKTVKGRPQDIDKLKQAVFNIDGSGLSGYYQKRSAELTKEIEATQREMSKYTTSQSSFADPLYEIPSSEKFINNSGEYGKLEERLNNLRQNYKDLNDATGTMLSYQLSAKADQPDKMNQIHAFDLTKAKEIGSKIKEVFNPIGAMNDKKRINAGYSLPQDVEYENARIGMDARIFTLANRLEQAKEKLKATPDDKATIDNFNGIVSEYNAAVSDYPKLSDKFPEVRRKELTQGLMDLYYNKVEGQRAARSVIDATNPVNKMGWGTIRNLIGYVLNETPSKEDIEDLSKQTGLSVAEINKINDEKSFGESFLDFGKRSNIRTNGLLSSTAAGFYGGLRNFEKFATRVGGAGYSPIDKTVKNEAVSRDIDNVRMGPSSEQLYQPETKIDLDRYDKDGNFNPNFLRRRINEDAGKFNINPASFVHTVGDTFGQLALFAGTGRIVGAGIEKASQAFISGSGLGAYVNAGEIAGMTRTATRFGELASTMGSGFALSYDDYYTQAAQFTNDEHKRNLSASANAAIEGISELIFPDVDVAKALRGNKNLFPVFDRLLKNNGGVVSGAMIKEYAGSILKGAAVANVEGLEEAVTSVGTALSDSIILDKKVDASQLAEQAKQAYVTTMIGMIPNAVGATIGSAARLKKEGLFEAGNEPTKYIDYVNQMVLKGKIEQPEADKKIRAINTMADIVQGIPQNDPNGNPYTVDQKVEIAAQEFRIRNNKKIKDSSTISAVKTAADADTEDAKKIQEAIVMQQPLYRLDGKDVTRDEMEQAIKENKPGAKVVMNDPEIQKLISDTTQTENNENKTDKKEAPAETTKQTIGNSEQASDNEENVDAPLSTEDLPAAVREKLKPKEPEPQQTASVPVMITNKMAGDLATLGFRQEERDRLTPQQAHDIINNGTRFEDLPADVRAKLIMPKPAENIQGFVGGLGKDAVESSQKQVDTEVSDGTFWTQKKEAAEQTAARLGDDYEVVEKTKTVTPEGKDPFDVPGFTVNKKTAPNTDNTHEGRVAAKAKDLNNNKTENNAIQEQSPTEGVLRDERIREEGELQGVQQGNEPEEPTQQSQEKEKVRPEDKILSSINGNPPNQWGAWPDSHPDVARYTLKGTRNAAKGFGISGKLPDAEIRTVQLENGKWISGMSVHGGADSEGLSYAASQSGGQHDSEQDAIEAQAERMRKWIKGKKNEKRVNDWLDGMLSPFVTEDAPKPKPTLSAPLQKAVDALSARPLNSMEAQMLESNPEGMVNYIAEQATGVVGRGQEMTLGVPGYSAAVSYYGKEAVDAAIDALPQEVKDFIERERRLAEEEDPAEMDPLTQDEVDELNKELAIDGITVNDIVNFETANVKPLIDESTNIPNPTGISEAGNDVGQQGGIFPSSISQSENDEGTDFGKDPAGESLKDSASASADSALSTEERLKKEISDKEDVFFRKLKAARSRFNALGPVDPETIAAGVDLLASYAKLGIYKLSTVIKRLMDKYGPEALDMQDLLAIRGVYAYHRDNSSKEERANMENIDEVDDFFINDLPLLRAGKKIEAATKTTEDSEMRNKPITPEEELIESMDTVRQFVDFVSNAIDNNRKLTIIDLRKEAARIGLVYNGDTHLQEIVELAVVEKTREIALSSDMDDEKLEQIVKIYEAQPALHQRTSERVEKQQYSTPAPISYVGGLFIAKTQPESVFEPSAGNGLLTIAFDPAIVQVNEIDKVRLSNLMQQGYAQITDQDATKPFKIAPVDGVITNPPFGGSPMREYDGYKISGLDEQMAINALNTMKDTGRAAIIIGGHMKYDDKGRLTGDRIFFNYLHNHYNVADVINIDGKLYSKQGTSFPIRMILIDGRKKTPTGAAPLLNEMSNAPVSSFADLFERVNNLESLQNTDDEKQADIQSEVDAGTVSGTTVHGDDAANRPADTSQNSGKLSSGKAGGTDNRSDGEQRASAGDNSGSARSKSGRGTNSRATSSRDNAEQPISNVETNVPGSSTEQSTESEPNDTTGSGEFIQRDRPVELDRKFDSVQLEQEKVPYIPASTGKSLELVIPTQMASEAQRTISNIDNEKGGVDRFVQNKLGYKSIAELHKALSAEQIDAVAIAIDNIEKGQGMIVGDMTGTGKGRIAASIIRYAVKQGLKPIFLTEKANLFSDLYRDLVSTGNGDLKPFFINNPGERDPTMYENDEEGNAIAVHKAMKGGQQKDAIFRSGQVPVDADFVVATYSQFTKSDKVKKDGPPPKPSLKKPYLLSIAQDNILIMDESHNVSGDSNSGMFFQDVMSAIKGVTFLSATFAKRPDNMAVYALKTAMSEANMTKAELIEAIEDGGVALQEVVSAQLVEAGQMLRRERSFAPEFDKDGKEIPGTGVSTQYDMLDHLQAEHRATADKVTAIMREITDFEKTYVQPVFSGMDHDIKTGGGKVKKTKGSKLGISNTPFASKVFNLVDQLLFAIKADAVADMAIEELKAGRKPVIAFKSTMESFLDSIDAVPGERLEKADFALTLKRGLDGTLKYHESDAKGNTTPKKLSVSELSQEGQREYARLVAAMKNASTGISISPIDNMHDKLRKAGYSSAEITGRKLTLEFQDDGSAIVTARKNAKVNKNVNAFQHGELDVIMINASGSTGLSLHASMDPKQSSDPRQRVLLTAQLELDINKEVQKRGRIDRVGQLVRGAFRYVVSSIPAESRLLMMFKAKVRSLDANTTSSQKSKTSDLDFPDFLNKHGDAVVTQYLRDSPEINDLMGDPLDLDDDEDHTVSDAARKITGRVAILDSGNQEKFYKEVAQRYEDYLKFLESNNANDLEVKTMPLNAKTVSKSTLIVGKGGVTPFGTDSFLEKVEVDNLKKPLTFKEVQEEVKTALNGKTPMALLEEMIAEHETYHDERVQREEQAIDEKYARLREEIPDKVVKEAAKKKIEDPAVIAQMVSSMEEDLQSSHSFDKGKLQVKEDTIHNNIRRRFNFFKVGDVYSVPTSIKIEANTGSSPAIFLGFTIKEGTKNKYAPSNIIMRFATVDSRRTIIVPLSKSDFIDKTTADSYNISDSRKEMIRSNWDKMESRKDRSIRYMVTGNLLQGFGTAGPGQLVSYTTDTGELRKGILLTDDYNPKDQKVRVPLSRMLQHIAKFTQGDSISTADHKIFIVKERQGYIIEVPASKAAGGDLFLDPELRDLVSGNNFRTSNGKMIAQFSDSKLSDVVALLDRKFSASIDVDQNLVPQTPLDGDVKSNAVGYIIEKLNNLKIKPNNELYAMAGIPIAFWNGAIEIVKAVVRTGGSVYAGIKQAAQFIRDNHTGPFDERQFSTEVRSELVTTGFVHGEMAPETMKLANKALKNIGKGSKIKDEVDKLGNFYTGLKPMLSAADGKLLDEELKLFSDYLEENAVEIPDNASRTQAEAYQKAKDMAEDIEKNNFNYQPSTNFQKTLNKTASAVDKALSNKGLNTVLNLPNYVQDRTVGWLKSKAGEGFRVAAEKMLESKAGIVRTIGGAMNGLFANIGKSVTDINKGEIFKGESSRRAVADAFKISENLRTLIDNNKQSMINIDQVLDVEPYQYLKNMSREEFASAIKGEEPDMTDAEIDQEYADMRSSMGFDDPNHAFKTIDTLSPEEKSAHDMIRTIYDFIHETNFALGLLPKEKYWRNYGKYSARAYDTYELPEEVQKAMNQSTTKLDLDGFLKREALTGWKALHKLGDPIYPMAKRLQQTLQNKAVIDYANYLIANKPDAVSKYETPGYTKLGYGYGPLSNKWVRDDIVEDYKGYFYSDKKLQLFYDFLKGYDRMPVRQFYKRIFTVYNPTVHLGNILSSSFFGWLSGISPLRLNANLPYAISQIQQYGEDYRRLLSEGVLGTDIALNDLRKRTNEVFGKQPPPGTPPPTQNALLPIRWVKTVLSKMEDFYGSTDDAYKLAGYHSLIQLGYSHEDAINKIKQGFQNYNRVGKLYDVGSKLPVIGSPFGKFAGDLARIVGEGITTRPLQTMAVLAGLQYMGVMLSRMAGETEEQRRRRANRPGATSLPVPHWFPEFLGGGTQGGISLSYRNPWRKNTELNIAKYLTPVFTYNSFDGDNTTTFMQKFSPLPLEKGDRYSFAPNGSYPVIAKNANDPVLGPIVQILANSDFRGVPILDPAENTYKKSTLTDGERTENAVRFLARAYVPHGAYVNDFYSAMQGNPDAYGRKLSPAQVFARFMGYKTLNFGPEKYDEVFNKRLKYWGNVFYEESKPIKDLSNKLRAGAITPDVYNKRYTELVETQAQIVSEANRDMERMSGNPHYFKSGEDLKITRSETLNRPSRRRKRREED